MLIWKIKMLANKHHSSTLENTLVGVKGKKKKTLQAISVYWIGLSCCLNVESLTWMLKGDSVKGQQEELLEKSNHVNNGPDVGNTEAKQKKQKLLWT